MKYDLAELSTDGSLISGSTSSGWRLHFLFSWKWRFDMEYVLRTLAFIFYLTVHLGIYVPTLVSSEAVAFVHS